MKKYVIIAALCLAAACTEEPVPFVPKADEGILTANLIIPKSVETVSGGTVTIPALGETRFSVGDVVLLKAIDGTVFETAVSAVSSSGVEFPLPSGVVSSYYDIVFRFGPVALDSGRIYISILSGEVEPVPVAAASGSTVYGIVECEGKGLPGVVVSDGYEVVRTDVNGIYQMKSEKMWKYVFISLPSGYEAPLQGVIPGFYAHLIADPSLPERHDFKLRRVANDNFTLFLLGDIHLANRADDIAQFRRDMRSLNASIDKAKGRCYVMTLGDMTWDGYWYSKNFYFPEYLAEVSKWFNDVPFFHTMGNHDNDMNRVGDIEKTRPFNEFIGPSYYSFNLGKVHFIVTDNIDYNDVGTGTDLRSEYKHDYTANQMAWLAKDLATVDRSTPVVISAHSPLFAPTGATTWKVRLNGADAPGEANTDDFVNAVEGYRVRFVGGHSHKIDHYEELASQGFTEHNLGAVCGAWWNSGYVEPGIHLCPDGSPSGYAVWEFTGTELKHRYQASGMREDYVFRAYDMGEVKKTLTMEAVDNEATFKTFYNEFQRFDDNDLLLNVWYWDSAWKVEAYADGKALMATRDYTYDPLLTWAVTVNYYARHASLSSSSIKPSKWPHFFRFRVPAGTVHVDVKVTDRNGEVHTESFSWPKPFSMDEYRIAN